MSDISKIILPDGNQYDLKDSVARTEATTTSSGLMSAIDKVKLDLIEDNAQENIIESISVNGDEVEIIDKNVDISVPKIDDIFSERTISGNPVYIEDAVNAPATNVTVGIKSAQNLNGYDHAWVGGAGENLLPKINCNNRTTGGVTYTLNSDGSVHVAGTPTTETLSHEKTITQADDSDRTWLEAGTYTVSAFGGRIWVQTLLEDLTTQPVSAFNVQNGGSKTITFTAKSAIYIRADILASDGALDTDVQASVVPGSTGLTTWEPYENICPIIGVSTVKVTRTGKNLGKFVNGINSNPTTGLPDVTYVKRCSTVTPIKIDPTKTYVASGVGNSCFIYAVLNNDTLIRRIVTHTTGGTVLDTSGGTDLYVTCFNNPESTNATVEDNLPMVTIQSDDDTYEPYQEQEVEIELKNKNLFHAEYVNDIGVNVDTTNCSYVVNADKTFVLKTTTDNADAFVGNLLHNDTSLITERGLLLFPVKPNTDYTVSIVSENNIINKNYIQFYKEDGYRASGYNGFTTTITRTSPSNAAYIGLRIGSAQLTANTDYLVKVQLEEGSAATDYVPYLGDVYGGTLDLTTGKLTVTSVAHVIRTYGLFTSVVGTGKYVTLNVINSINESASVICDRMPFVSYENRGQAYQLYYGPSGKRFVAFVPSDATITDVANALDGGQIVYQLETPIEYALTPQQIEMLSGENIIWSNANGNIDVTYKVRPMDESVLDSYVTKDSFEDAGIKDRTYTTILNETLTTAATEGWNNPHATAATTYNFDKQYKYRVTFNDTEYILSCKLWWLTTSNGGFKVYEYLGNLGLYTSTTGVTHDIDNTPFIIINDLSGNLGIDVLTKDAGTYTVKVERITYTKNLIPKSLIYNNDYYPIEHVNNGTSTFDSVSIGVNTITNKRGSVAIGFCNTINNQFGTAIGAHNIVNNNYAYTEGYHNTSSGNASHSEGAYTTASENGSHSEGIYTTASGSVSHAEGMRTVASGHYSHAEGYGTVAKGNIQHVNGSFNIIDDNNTYVEIVGNSLDENNRSNAYTLDWNGNATYAGKVTVGAEPTEDMDLTPKQYVDNAFPTVSLSGNPVYAKGAITSNIDSMALTLKPTQTGTGDPSPDNVRPIVGFDDVTITQTVGNLWPFGDPQASLGTTPQEFYLKQDTYKLATTTPSNSNTWAVRFWYADDSGSELHYSNTTFTLAKDVSGVTWNTAATQDVKLERVITTQVTFTDDAGTVYGGTLDLNTGVLTVDTLSVTLGESMSPIINNRSDTGGYAWVSSNNRLYFEIGWTNGAPQYAEFTPDRDRVDEILVDSLTHSEGGERGTWRTSFESGYQYPDGSALEYVHLYLSDVTSLTEARAYLKDNPAQFVYPLKYPKTYQLTPVQIKTLIGDNTFTADSGANINLTYRAKETRRNNIYWGRCDSAGEAQNKVATVNDDFILEEGATCFIYFANTNTYGGPATLNVNGTGAMPFHKEGTANMSSSVNWGYGGHTFLPVIYYNNSWRLCTDLFNMAATTKSGLMSAGDKTTLNTVSGYYQLTDEDLNNIRPGQFGVYWAESNNTCAHKPTAITVNAFALLCMKTTSAYMLQVLFHATSNRQWRRYYNGNSGNWSGWSEITYSWNAASGWAGLMSAADKVKLDGLKASTINVTDTYGLCGTTGATVTIQDLMDAIASKV